MDHIKSLFTRQPTQHPSPPTLDELWHDLSLQAMSQGVPGSSELRANSPWGPVRLKKGSARLTDLTARQAHRDHAYALFRDSFSKSVDLHLRSVPVRDRKRVDTAFQEVWTEQESKSEQDRIITQDDVAATFNRFEEVRNLHGIQKRYESTRRDLVALYRQLNPKVEDSKWRAYAEGEDFELRADADSDQIRIKRRTALFTNEHNRRVHQVRAYALVAAAFERELEKYEANVDPKLYHVKSEDLINALDNQVGDGSKPITLRMANCLAMQVAAIMAHESWQPPEPPYDPGQPVHKRDPQPVNWHPLPSQRD